MRTVRPVCLRSVLLRGASALSLVSIIGAGPAMAQTASALRAVVGIAAISAPKAPTATSTTASTASNIATLRALQYQARLSQGVDLAKQAQAAAQAAVQAVTVPDGLATGGLDPVKIPMPAAQDPTGLNTWEGANAPVQTTTSGAAVNVTIKQTQARAILSWQTFNVGKNTTVTFDQSQNGTNQADWVALNRVVGQINPNTGLRDASQAPAPSVILGQVKAPGTVIVLNQNGVLFGAGSQIDVHTLVATSLEIGRAYDTTTGPLSIAQRDSEFLNYGLLGYADQASATTKDLAFTFSAQAVSNSAYDPMLEGTIQVQAGATINSDSGGAILLAGPKVINSGHLTSPQGEVVLQSGREITLQRSDGSATANDPNVRGFTVSAVNRDDAAGNYVQNTATGWIEAPEGYVSLAATQNGAVLQQGMLDATTSVSRNGYISIYGGDIKLDIGSTIAITPDDSDQTIPQDPTSLADFKSSKVAIGNSFDTTQAPLTSRIEIDNNSLIYAPGADVRIGSTPGLATIPDALSPGASRIFIDSSAVIDVAGLTNVLIPASRNSIKISPVKGNELQDTPDYKDSFLNGATVYVDPRLSGVRSDGVTWVGSPLIAAESYYQQVGVTASELMTKGGNITLSVASSAAGAAGSTPDIIVKPGAILDMSGGWVTYQAGFVQTSTLINAQGQAVDISQADPDDVYVAIYSGYTNTQPRWGLSTTWADPLLQGGHYEASYTEGRDAGSLIIKSSSLVLDGNIYGEAYAGPQQLIGATAETASSGIFGDKRLMQGANSQLPAGGFLYIQALGQDSSGNVTGGADVSMTAGYQPIAATLSYGQSISIDAMGNLVKPDRDPASILSADRQGTILLSSDALSASGLSQLTVNTSGAFDIASDASLKLNPGGILDVTAGAAITVDGVVTAPGGRILLETVNTGLGNIFNPTPAGPGSFDVVVNGTLSTRGLWTNDFIAAPGQDQGAGFIGGGDISIIAAPRVTELQETASVADTKKGTAPQDNIDISGSILINSGALLDVSGGGYVTPTGDFDLSAKGGNISLINQTNYFQLADDTANRGPGGLSGLRVSTLLNSGGNAIVAVNPDVINAQVTIADGTILAAGFAGGGTFTLDTPQFQFGSGPLAGGTQLPLDFFSRTGFASYDITSYGTALFANPFTNALGGTDALLATQILNIGSGQTLSLSESQFSPVLTDAQTATLRNLGSGGDLYSVMTPTIAPDAWDRNPVNLTLGGLLELHVQQGGTITGEAGAVLTVPQLFNEGAIRIPGGQIIQSEVLPTVYYGNNVIGVHDITDVFGTNAAGQITETAANALGIKSGKTVLTNAQVAAQYSIYLLGDLDAGEGVRLAPGSVTDLSGVSIIDPRAPVQGIGNIKSITNGRMVAGGTIDSLPALQLSTPLFDTSFGISDFNNLPAPGTRVPSLFNANAGAVINLSGASDTYQQLQLNGTVAAMPVWSDAGTLAMESGGTITGALIDAHGGAANAQGGTLTVLDPVLTQVDAAMPLQNGVSAAMISGAGFTTLVAEGSVSTQGDATIQLGDAFFLVSRPYGGLPEQNLNTASVRDSFAPVVRSNGLLEIDAPYIAFDSQFQSLSASPGNSTSTNSAIFKADTIDITGAVSFDKTVGDVELVAAHDLRLTGVQPWQTVFNLNTSDVANSLIGQLAVSNNLSLTAAQIYPTTGSSFSISAAGTGGTITIGRSAGETPAAPYSAGGNLTIQAANIVQGGVVRVPLGNLTLGGTTALAIADGSGSAQFAPVTTSLSLLPGSVTSVSADGLSIPYGTTTDQSEWYFAPTSASALTAPPAGSLNLAATSVAMQSGATVDVSGGGDIYAYEFIPGTGGSRDILDRLNADPFSSHNGLQYPDGRQVYAIVPGLSQAAVAAIDPIYSSDYSALYTPSGAGTRVYLSAAPGLAAGWYTLLPAQYAMLPGGMRVVEQSASAPLPTGSSVQNDGSELVTGYYGGLGSSQSTVRTFNVMSQNVILKYSDIQLTSGDAKFAADAAKNGDVAPRLPIDAGKLVIAPVTDLTVDATLQTAPGKGGRGAEVDISGSAFAIGSTEADGAPDGTIALSADDLTNLNASSLLIGGIRTDNSDGTTSLAITAHSIDVENDAAHPVTAPEIVMAVDGSGAGITLHDGATVIASGSTDDTRTGDYIVDGQVAGMTGQGAVVRLSVGPQRQVARQNIDANTSGGVLRVGAVTLDAPSLLLESSGDAAIAPNAAISATDLAIGAGQVSFTDDPSVTSGLVVDASLQSLLAQVQQLTIRTPNAIGFSDGTYSFGNLSLDTPGLSLLDGSAVSITATSLSLSNSGGAAVSCAAACGAGSLALSATSVDFAGGSLATAGFGQAVQISSGSGIFYDGVAGLDVGSARLSLLTPLLEDRAATQSAVLSAAQSTVLPSLSLTTTGDIAITAAASAADAPNGVPGSSLNLSGNNVSISGTRLRATAGTLQAKAAGGITVSSGAALEAPGYAATLGDSADPVSVSAPGGTVALIALGGDIDLESGTALSVGGGSGQAGTLALQAANGAIAFGATIDANAPDGGASLLIDQQGAFDMSSLATLVQGTLNGNIDIRTGTGDLALSADQSLKAQSVSLTADGGLVDIAGTIDTSGVSGGDITLYGQNGVTLDASAKLLARAQGYGASDTRQAKGGDVTIGTEGAGAITVAAGAAIDVSALSTADRLVPTVRNGVTYYSYVEGDTGGTVTVRAPLIDQPGGETVNVAFQGGISGASSVVLEGYKSFDLSAVAANPDFVGVSINSTGQAVLDLTTPGSGGAVNFLADNASGTLVNFIQNFDLSSTSGNVGGMTASGVFHAQPGVELTYSGDVVLNSNWNLGAGTVDVAGAVAAGLMAPDPSLAGKYYVIAGDEAALFQNYTNLTYRVGGKVDGEPGVLSIRAGGTLDLKGSITDGFFQFRDQTDPDYLTAQLGGGNAAYDPSISAFCSATCSTSVDFQGQSLLPASYVTIAIPAATGLGSVLEDIAPYSAAANTPGAVGSLAGGTGDPLGSAELFPRIATADGKTKPVLSWSYQLVGGADRASADPMRVAAGSGGNVVVEGDSPYSFSNSVKGTGTYTDNLLLRVGAASIPAADWNDSFVSANPGLDQSAYTYVNISSAPAAVKSFIVAQSSSFFAAYPGQFTLVGSPSNPTGFATTLALAAKFMTDVVGQNMATILSSYKAPAPTVVRGAVSGDPRTLVRSGSGSIAVAAANNIDLSDGATPTYKTLTGAAGTAKSGFQVGGTSIYTAGYRADLTARTVTDAATGITYTVDPTTGTAQTDVFAIAPSAGYHYGASGAPNVSGAGYSGILLANPVYAQGGGDVSLNAGNDVLGRRDQWQEARLAAYYDLTNLYGYDWIGTADQAWRVGTVGMQTNIAIDPQLFSEGVGALGGGDITVNAGRDISDISIVSDSSVTTAAVTTSQGLGTQALWTVGGGNVSVTAGRNIVGGRLDVASGSASVSAGGAILSDGTTKLDLTHTAPNDLRVRVTDATVAISAEQGITLLGIASLGTKGASSDYDADQDARGFYSATSGVSLLSDGNIFVDNVGTDVVSPSDKSTGLTLTAIWPGSFGASSLTGDIQLVGSAVTAASAIVLYPSPTGNLTLFAAQDIAPVTIAMEDADPGLLPGAFSSFHADSSVGVSSGLTFIFPGVLPDTSEVDLREMHNSTPTHTGDTQPVRIYAGQDITDMIVSVPKAVRVYAGRDLINMMFFGQNLAAGDITRIVAGRDITATTELLRPLLANGQFGALLPALQGNSFVLGGPGSFFLEAGRDAGPFLNSAVTDGFINPLSPVAQGVETYGGGVMSVGNDWNPWLTPAGASVYVEFGVGNGAAYDQFRDYYLDPANLANLDGDLFVQVRDSSGNLAPDRTQPIYAPVLIGWMQSNAAVQLQTAFGTTNVSYQQAYDVFKSLPELQQRVFILDNVYFNELTATALPDGPSYKQYARGYRAIDTLFPASLGYTANDLSGGGNGASTVVETGDLDLRLSTIQTSRGGNIYILGPGGRVLAGSTVRTSDQAARRAYDGGRLFDGNIENSPVAAAIDSIPVGYEGVLTLRGGGIYTFTDQDFLLNQSRLFTEAGGDIAMWSSNGDLNAGQGPKTSANFPPVVVRVDADLNAEVYSAGGVSGAGIAAFQPAPGVESPNVYLIAPRGTVDAGDAGVRVAGNLYIAAQSVANADNFSVSGTAVGISANTTVSIGVQNSGAAAAAAATQAAQGLASTRTTTDTQSIISVEVEGFAGTPSDVDDEDQRKRRRKN